MNDIRIAVSLSGMPRNFEQCYQNTLEFFNIDNAQVDFFIHCWSNHWYPKRVKSPYEDPETGKILEQSTLKECLTKVYEPKCIEVENQIENLDLINTIKFIKDNLLRKTSKSRLTKWMVKILESDDANKFLSSPFHLAQTYSISRTANIISKHEQDYDLVVRYRFDNYIELRDKSWRTKMFHDMVNLIRHAEHRSSIAKRFHRDYLFVSWLTAMGECGFARNTTWIGDKIFACSKNKFADFSKYFQSQINRIVTYDRVKSKNECATFFMPEQTLYDMCLNNSFFVHSKGYLNKLSLLSYRDYHLNLEQTFETLQQEYIKREKMNHDSAEGIVLGL